MSGKDFMILAAISGALAVAIGAFGAHALKEIMTEAELANFKTASQYHYYHTLLLLFVGYYANRNQKRKLLIVAGYFITSGMILFSFSLYAYAALQNSWIAMITPVGGLMLIIGWVVLAVSLIKSRLGD